MTTEAKVVLTGDDSPLRRTLASARDNLNKFGSDAASPFLKLRDSVGNLGNLVAGFGAIRLIGLADDASLIQARLKDVTGSIQAAAQAQGQLFQASQRLQVSYGDMAGSFSKMLPAVRELGGGANEAVKLAELLAVTARLSGASSQAAAASAQQFAQALQSGVLQGDELKSILENNGTLARTLADALGLTVGELRRLGSEGKLTSDKVAQALLGQYDVIKARSAELPVTVGGAFQQLTNSFQRLVDSFEQGTGVFGNIGKLIQQVSRLVDALSDSMRSFDTTSKKIFEDNWLQKFARTGTETLAGLIDLGSALTESAESWMRTFSALGSAASSVAAGDFSRLSTIYREWAAAGDESWRRIQDRLNGTGGSVLGRLRLQGDAGGGRGFINPSMPSAELISNPPPGKRGKAEAEDPGRMASLEVALDAQKAYLIEQGKLLDQAKEFELRYWEEILATARLTEKERDAIAKKAAALRVEIAREGAKEAAELDKEAVEAYKDMELLKIEAARIAAKNLLDQDQITKADAIAREIEFEEQRLQVMQEYLRRRQELLPEGDLAGRARLSNQSTQEGQQSANRRAQLGGELAKENAGFDLGETFAKMGDAAVSGFSRIELSAQKWRQSMMGIFEGVKSAFMRAVIEEPLRAQVAAWAKQLAIKLGFVAQEKTLDATGAAATVAVKAGETTAVAGMNAVQAATGAAASQAPIPVVGPYLALAAMGAIFAAVSAMGGKMKSARNGYDIPAGVNPITQLHEEEMVLPKEQANAIRDMASGGGGGQPVSVTYNDHSGKLSDSEIRRKAGVIAQELNRVHRNGWRPA